MNKLYETKMKEWKSTAEHIKDLKIELAKEVLKDNPNFTFLENGVELLEELEEKKRRLTQELEELEEVMRDEGIH